MTHRDPDDFEPRKPVWCSDCDALVFPRRADHGIGPWECHGRGWHHDWVMACPDCDGTDLCEPPVDEGHDPMLPSGGAADPILRQALADYADAAQPAPQQGGEDDYTKMPPALTPEGRVWSGRFYSRFIAMGHDNNTAVVNANHAADVVLYHLATPAPAAPAAAPEVSEAATAAINALMAIGSLVQNDRGTWKIRQHGQDMAALVAEINRAVPIARAALSASAAGATTKRETGEG